MRFNEYQQLSKRTMPKPFLLNSLMDIYDDSAKSNYAMGLSGESGEVTDLIKKELYHGHSAEPMAIKKELGDVLHYLSGLATMYGLSLEEIAAANIEKLKKRYPDGFSQEASINRED